MIQTSHYGKLLSENVSITQLTFSNYRRISINGLTIIVIHYLEQSIHSNMLMSGPFSKKFHLGFKSNRKNTSKLVIGFKENLRKKPHQLKF